MERKVLGRLFETHIMNTVKNNQNSVLVISSSFKSTVNDLNVILSEKYGRIGLITLAVPAEVALAGLEKSEIDPKKFVIMECSGGKSKSAIKGNVIHTTRDLDSMTTAIDKMLKSNVDLIILDSISMLLIYNEEIDTIRFIHHVVNTVRKKKTKALYLITKDDMTRKTMKDLELFTDAIIRI